MQRKAKSEAYNATHIRDNSRKTKTKEPVPSDLVWKLQEHAEFINGSKSQGDGYPGGGSEWKGHQRGFWGAGYAVSRLPCALHRCVKLVKTHGGR